MYEYLALFDIQTTQAVSKHRECNKTKHTTNQRAIKVGEISHDVAGIVLAKELSCDVTSLSYHEPKPRLKCAYCCF